MKTNYKYIGKVRPTIEGDWSNNKKYDILSIVYDVESNKSYISNKNVPIGISITNKDYWQLFGNTRIDSDSILILSNNKNGFINSFTLSEAINSIHIEDRRLGLFISFYENTKDINSPYRWNLYQFTSNNIDDFLDENMWTSIYFTKNKFIGFINNEKNLYYVRNKPIIGDYAYVGDTLLNAEIYRCYNNNIWTNTNEKVSELYSIKTSNEITIGDNGNWFIDGKDTGISATNIIIDDNFSETSKNALQNKVITNEFNIIKNILNSLRIDISNNENDSISIILNSILKEHSSNIINIATPEKSGLMSYKDKQKLDNIYDENIKESSLIHFSGAIIEDEMLVLNKVYNETLSLNEVDVSNTSNYITKVSQLENDKGYLSGDITNEQLNINNG